jgi:GAF domain-containing protein
MAQYPDGLGDTLRVLSRLMVDEETLDQTLHRVASLACLSLENCDAASVTLEQSEERRTAASTDDVALALDEGQYSADAGPCLTALRTKERIVIDSIPDDRRWPVFVAAAAAHGVLSSLSLPLFYGGDVEGALNLYSRERQGFPVEAQEHGTLFAEQASVAIANAEVYWRTYDLTQNLQSALENRDVIGQAKGILMARHGITADQAFDELRRASQRRNTKLREIADMVTLIGELPLD